MTKDVQGLRTTVIAMVPNGSGEEAVQSIKLALAMLGGFLPTTPILGQETQMEILGRGRDSELGSPVNG